MENNEIYEVLNELGLDDEEIESVEKRNKLLKNTITEDINDIIEFFSIKCELSKDDIARIVIKNPLILNESLDRIHMLSNIYAQIGFTGKEYKNYLVNYGNAFSLNPRELMENITGMMQSGKSLKDIREELANNYNKIF